MLFRFLQANLFLIRCIATLCFLPGLAAGQPTNDTITISLPQAEQLFIKNNLQLLAQRFSIDGAKANVITAKEINDVPLSKKGHEPVSKKINTLSEYNLQAFQYQYAAFAIFLKQNNKRLIFGLNNPFIDSPGKPPNC